VTGLLEIRLEMGPEYLAAGHFGRPNVPPHLLDPVEVSMIMQTAGVASSLPKADRLQLAKYTNTVCDAVKHRLSGGDGDAFHLKCIFRLLPFWWITCDLQVVEAETAFVHLRAPV
jgi:hypothetical protein